jgi:hypothetical protein
MPSLQFSQKSLENLWRYIQSRASLPAHLLKYISIKHHHFGSNWGTVAIHQQRQTIPHHQAIAITSILAEIAQELVKTHPIKHEPSLTPPKIHINQTSPFRKRLRRRCHPPTTPHDSPPIGFAFTSILTEIAWELSKAHPIKREPFLTPPKTHLDRISMVRKQSRRCYHHPPSMPNSPSLSGNCLYSNSPGKQWELVEIHQIKRNTLTTPPKTTQSFFFMLMINLSCIAVTTPPFLTMSHLSLHYLHCAVTCYFYNAIILLEVPSHTAISKKLPALLPSHHTTLSLWCQWAIA